MRLSPEAKIEDIKVGSHQRASIMIGIPTFGMVPIEFVVTFGRLQMPMNGLTFQHIVKGFEVGVARNLCVEYVLNIPEKDRPDWIFFLGDDMLPEWNGLTRLYEEAVKNHWDCLTGMYYLKGEPPTPLLWRHDHIGRMNPGVHFQPGEVVQVDMTGVDFTLIRVSLLEKMKSPWFKTGPTDVTNVPEMNRNGSTEVMSHTEDAWFYSHAKELGAKIGVHSGVRVAHLDVKTGVIY